MQGVPGPPGGCGGKTADMTAVAPSVADWLPRRALVVGLARSGQAAALALAAYGAEVAAHLGSEDETLLEGVDLLVKSPGVPSESPLPTAARVRRVPVWSEVELGYRLLRGRPLVGVTGTNGKTTTTELLAAIYRAAGRPVEVAGNIGRPLVEVAETAPADATIICELSSFQLEDVHELACEIAVLLNLEPDHLDRHGTFESYRDTKLRIFDRARTAIVPRGLAVSTAAAARVEFAAGDPLPADPLIPGAHNRENAAAATAAARAAGLPDDAIALALRTFPGVAHRLELVRELDGVRYVNDSKATNTAAARRGVLAYDAPLHLILGGSLKGEDFATFARDLPATVRTVHLVGEAADALAVALDAAGRSYERAGDLETAIGQARAVAEPGEVVLLSPACASFDQFEDFEQRGDAFRRLVMELA
jgi:UDP-N-acetylmuramoylalanine--D-glutamate ligase